ncbi:hypothetical protein Xen7305DRAFT_00016570 [Xenococcus sp. PCC 7305]|uniref:hypothetical protein n=1 Tax=Xenococcus sp. PCC 7305 TaxID=102125 RepID=UPI0002AC8225|nr:hypothetical protein [Xenococcus sp. PCC 7305]ELS01948.1 hypothetical protein Xen7305DRAFT_00016570 [Xenococcus sp. PCC 7305]
MQLKVPIKPSSIVRYLAIGAIILIILSTGIQIGKYVFDYRESWTRILNLDREMNVPTWLSAWTLAFCALLLKIIAQGKKQQGDRSATDWQLLSTIFVLMALDEVLSVHEILIIPEVSKALNLPWFLHSLWVIPGAIFVLWFGKRFWKFTQNLPYKSRRHFFLAAAFYVGGALIMEAIGSHVAEAQGQQNLTYALIATVEEAMEMTGMIVFIYGLLFYLQQWSPNLLLQIDFVEGKGPKPALTSKEAHSDQNPPHSKISRDP